MKNRILPLAAATFAAVAIGVVPAGAAPPTVTPDAAAAPAATTEAVDCVYSPAVPADRFQGFPTFDPVRAAQPYTILLVTSQGIITVEALTDRAPCTTNSFRFLAQNRYYDRTHCHRLTVERIFVLQCGDPTGTGSGGPGWSFPDENLEGATYPAGTVAMANAGPSTNGSQFFFTWQDTTLRPAFTPFGRVTRGMDVLRRIAAGGQDDQNRPGDGYPTLPVDFLKVQIIPHR